MSRLVDIVVREASHQATMTFEELVKGCTPDEREQLAWHLAMLRARRTFDALSKPCADALGIRPSEVDS